MRYTIHGPGKSQVCGNATLRAIVSYLRRRRTPATVAAIANAAAVTCPTARRWLHRLERRGFVVVFERPLRAVWLRTKGRSFEARVHRTIASGLRMRPLIDFINAMAIERSASKEAAR